MISTEVDESRAETGVAVGCEIGAQCAFGEAQANTDRIQDTASDRLAMEGNDCRFRGDVGIWLIGIKGAR